MAQSALKNFTDESLLGQPITLNNCDREPIHIPGLIQPYGFLLCLDEQSRRVVQASANTLTLLGMAAETLIGAGLGTLLEPEQLLEVERVWAKLGTDARLLGIHLGRVTGQPAYKLILHRYDGLLWVEGEPLSETSVSALDLPALNVSLGRLLTAESVLECCQVTAEQVRTITGFDRVAIYRFAPDDSGEVIAEDVREDLPPWLGMHYPATDIPKQARAMYLKNWLRFIPNAHYAPVPLVPTVAPGASRPPDMTYSVLRSVSPIHLEYLHNLGSEATMTISLIQEGRLWGMVTCHHQSPRLVSYELRDLCQFLGKTVSALLKTKELQDEQAYRLRIREAQVGLFDLVSTQANFMDGLHRFTPNLLDVLDCGGAAIVFDGEVITLGHTPKPRQIEEIVEWLRANNPHDVFVTDSYAQLNPAGKAIRTTASGILAVALAREACDYILWFRPEQLQTVTWAGRHEKNQTTADGQIFLSPRQSFEAWKQTVEETSAPWLPLEVEAAKEIRLHISDIRLKVFNELQAKALSLTRLNAELERSNDELDSFAYVASHDLKEPLRGIHNYSLFLLEDYADKLDDEGVSKLRTLVRLSQRMEALIESLLQLSRVGRVELVVEAVNLNDVLTDILDLLHPRFEQTRTTVTVAGPLPTVRGSRTSIQEVFNNLLTNSLRYNNHAEKRVTIGVASPEIRGPKGTGNPADFVVISVQDNGIGIDPKHHENIFKIFKRLHAQDKYGGGTGAGLAIARKMAEKNGGELWVDSTLGHGATFYFSIPISL
ncbi:GAF domain-containing protein [Microvirga sp. STS02]|uniref:ATP-binding protein n=1 Tax=Hymenobacter negativus TaxID=2795026 RepID=UPI0018DE4CB3|nr:MULTISPECIES: ATP-binding protein [Bacteria]MBH8569534.1 GAF domain-containing protein [Hymenobacter negativus]MBR7209270.1 GAF domain-containing protein [Microvirga sp. STS02]